ncbi:MAG TPA: C4-dicarboxylate transporter DctA [Steroidobacteraceae bacterium]|nr:C4-dicarboxylate transporter DctA [Steroidobacteraceae bacterium]
MTRTQVHRCFMGLVRQLWVQVLLATGAGIALGHWWPKAGADMKPLGDAFIALVRMLIAPVIFCTVVHGVAAMNDMRRVGRVALKALLYFEGITTLALVLALLAVNVLEPGSGMHVAASRLDVQAVSQYTARAHAQGVAQFLLDIIPATFLDAFAHTEVLPVLFVSVLFAAGLAACGERGQPLKDLIDSAREVFFRIVALVMWVAPLGAFGAMAFTVGRFGTGSLVALGRLILTLYGVSAVFVLVVFGAVSWWCGVSLWRLLGYIREEIVIVAATTSTETVLPQVMRKMRALGCEDTVVGLVVPTGYSFNLDGTCLYLATVAVFLAQATDTVLTLGGQLTILAVLLLTSKGAAGVAGAAFVVLAATLGSVGTIPVASIALVLGIHRLLAEALTFVNLVGNCLATLVVARWEGALDRDVLQRQIGRRPAAVITQAGR